MLMLPLPQYLPLLPGDRICQDWLISTANLAQELQQILLDHLVPASQCLICHSKAVPDKHQCVGNLSSMLLLHKLLLVCRPRRRFFIRWQNLRVRHPGIPSADMVYLPLVSTDPQQCNTHGNIRKLVRRDLQEQATQMTDVQGCHAHT